MLLKNMRILITGINGFIGQHLAHALLKRGHNVAGLGRNKKCKVDNIKTYYQGTALDKKLVKKAVKNAEVVIHLAALTSHKDIVDNSFATLETNFLGTKSVLDAFSKSKQTRKFLYSSTGKVYGKIRHLPISEDHPTNPQNVLGKSKLITEKLIDFYNSARINEQNLFCEYNDKQSFSSNNQKEFIILRIFNVYGPGQSKNFLIPTILKQLDGGKKEIILGDVEAKRDHVYIDDVARAFILAVERKGHKGLFIYNICTGIASSASQIVKMISKIKGVDIKVKIDSTLIRRDEMKDEYGSYRKAKRVLSWEPKVSLREGLEKTIKNENNLQVIIMAGGEGTRMWESYPKTPKLLIPLKGKPLIDHLIDHLKKNGCRNIVICTGYLGDKVKDYLDKKDYGLQIKLSMEEKPLGTGGALNLIKDLLENDFFVLYGDVFTTINLRKMLQFHKKKKAVVTAAIHPSGHPEDSNLVEFSSNFRITKILMKPHAQIPENPYNLAALYLVSSDIRKYLLSKTPYDFERDLLTKLVDENVPVYGYNTFEVIMDIGTPERLEEAERLLRK